MIKTTPWTREEEDHLVELVKAGLTNAEIGVRLSRTKDSVEKRKGALRSEGRLPAVYKERVPACPVEGSRKLAEAIWRYLDRRVAA